MPKVYCQFCIYVIQATFSAAVQCVDVRVCKESRKKENALLLLLDWNKALTNIRQRAGGSVQIHSEIKSYVWLNQTHTGITT